MLRTLVRPAKVAFTGSLLAGVGVRAMSSFSVETVQPGVSSETPKKGDMVTVHYTGKLASNGNVFDSSVKRNQPFQFQIGVGQVIKGWDEGVMQMTKGEKAVITCPPEYGYGARGFPPVIPPKSTLIFDVELIDFKS